MTVRNPKEPKRTVFFVSDRTGVTAEMVARSILTQFEHIIFEQHSLPFVDSIPRAIEASQRINQAAEADGVRPIVFSTLVNPEIRGVIAETSSLFLDCVDTFVGPLEQELGMRSTHVIGGTRLNPASVKYFERIEAINFTLGHDDGLGGKDWEKSEVILIGVSRCGKTPTSLYMAIQFGVRAANCPLIPEDLNKKMLPQGLLAHRSKLYGLTIDPIRLHQIRSARRPGSSYASFDSCRDEVRRAEMLMKEEGIRVMDTTAKSIEEIATAVIYQTGLERKWY